MSTNRTSFVERFCSPVHSANQRMFHETRDNIIGVRFISPTYHTAANYIRFPKRTRISACWQVTTCDREPPGHTGQVHAERKAQEQVWSKNHVVHLMHIYIHTYLCIHLHSIVVPRQIAYSPVTNRPCPSSAL